MLKTLRYRAFAGIVGFILLIPEVTLIVLRELKKLSDGLLPIFYILIAVESILYIYYLWGFKIVGDKTKNNMLKISMILLIISSLLTKGYHYVWNPAFPHLTKLIISASILVVMGIIGILAGMAILKLKNKFGSLATTVGVLNIISGISTATVIFFFIALLILIPQTIFEIVLLFRASEKL